MAITVNYPGWDKISDYIYEFLRNRKTQFDKKIIFNNIKQNLINLDVSKEILDCVHFEFLFNSTLDILVDNYILYETGDIYTPVDYMILKSFDTRFAELFYFRSNPPTWLNVSTTKEIPISDISQRDYLLCNGMVGTNFIQPDIPFSEIHRLYHELISEGAEKHEAIEFILNYYDIQILPDNDLCKVISIKRKVLIPKQISKKDND